jgi:Na+/H+ antiporter NhaC
MLGWFSSFSSNFFMGLLLAFPYLDPFQTLLFSIPFNFYPILTLLFVMFLAYTGKSFGPMKKFEEKDENQPSIGIEEKESAIEGKAFNMIFPLLTMVLSMPLFLIYSGWDFTENERAFSENIWLSISNGSGSMAVLYSVALALLTGGIMYGIQKLITIESFFEQTLKGMGDMIIMAILMVLAFAVGGMCNELGTGIYVAEVTSEWLSPAFAPVILFLTSCFVAFATGTSWGTFAIMISIAMPLAESIGINPYLALGAVLGGGVFGDHCSPISDTTLIASVASGSDHIDHVKTQLPYALITGSIATIGYLIVGILLI